MFDVFELNLVRGGLHLFAATDEQLNWTGDKLRDFQVADLVGTHCTGIEALHRPRERARRPDGQDGGRGQGWFHVHV